MFDVSGGSGKSIRDAIIDRSQLKIDQQKTGNKRWDEKWNRQSNKGLWWNKKKALDEIQVELLKYVMMWIEDIFPPKMDLQMQQTQADFIVLKETSKHKDDQIQNIIHTRQNTLDQIMHDSNEMLN